MRTSNTSTEFPSTCWTLVGRLRKDEVTSQDALAELCEIYWFPIYSFLRKKGLTPEDSEDLTQSFFAKLLVTKAFTSALENCGKLRTLLLTSLQNHRTDQWRHDNAARRGGGSDILSLDLEQAEGRYREIASIDCSPDETFDQSWFATVIQDAKAHLRGAMEKRGRAAVFDILEGFLDEEESDSDELKEAAKKLGIAPGSMRVTVHRLREKFRQLVRMRIEDTVEGKSELIEEFAYFSKLGHLPAAEADQGTKRSKSHHRID